MSTYTLRERLTDRIEVRQRELARAESVFAQTPAVLLDLIVPSACHRVWTFMRSHQLEIMYETTTLEEQRTTAALLMDLLNISSGDREEDADYKNAIVFFVGEDVKVFVNRPSNDCAKRARIVEERTITFCGDLDESRYLKVEYLTDKEATT